MAAVCKYMHESVKRLTDDYLKNEGRYVYVTPTSYLDLLSSLNGLLTLTRNKLTAKRDSYTQGVEKLEETAIEVGKMQQDLTDKQPKLQVMKA
jgi:dynein heavy chain